MPGHLRASEAPEDLWTCHECGWTYPNHHPSAKHRRNHKKVCGSIPGFIGTISSRTAPPGQPASSVIVDGASSDDDSSDDDTTQNKTHEPGHHHQKVALAQEEQSVAATAGTRTTKTLCAMSQEQCLQIEEALDTKPAPLTERSILDQNNRKAVQSVASTPNAPVKPHHVRRRSAHALEGVWMCRHCAWTYPNAHPSAKHRRKHKKKCPALVVTPRQVVGAGGSSDDASSDEETKRRDAGPFEKQEAPEMNVTSTTSSLPTDLEAFLGRCDSKRELQETIILLSPKVDVSRRNSFKRPRHRKEGPSGFLSPRGGVIKASKAVNNNQAQEEVLAAIEKKPEDVSDQENEDSGLLDPVVLNLPAVRLVTNSLSAPEADLDNEGGDSLQRRRSSLSDESDLITSDGEALSSPDSVLQPVHLLLPTSTTTEDTGIPRDNQEKTDEEPLHQIAAAAVMKLDAETDRDESANEALADKQNQHGAALAPQLAPLIFEGTLEVESSMSNPSEVAAAADRTDSEEVSSVNSCQPVDASPCAEVQIAGTERICCVVKERGEKLSLSGWKYLASSLVLNAAVESTIEAHVEASVLDSNIAADHISVAEGLVVGGASDIQASIGCEHHGVQAKEARTKEDKEAARSLSSVVLSSYQLSGDDAAAEVVKEESDEAEVQSPCIDPIELSSETTILPAETQSSASRPPDTIREDVTSLKPSAHEKVQEEEAFDDAITPPSMAIGILDLNSLTLPTAKSQVVVTGPVGDEDQGVRKCDETESQKARCRSVATNPDLSVREEEEPDASFRSGAAEEKSKAIEGSGVADESSKTNVFDEIASKGAEQQQSSSHLEASSKLTSSTSSVTEDQIGVDELKSYVNNVEEGQEVSPALAKELCEVNTTKDQDHENAHTDEGSGVELSEVVEPSSIEGDDGYLVIAVVGKKVNELGEKEVQAVAKSQGLAQEIGDPFSSTLSARSSSSSDIGILETGAASVAVVTGSNIGSKQQQVASCEKQAPIVVVNVSQVERKEKAPAAKQAGIFGQYKEKFSKLQREPSVNPRESQPAMTRLPGSGKRKLLPSVCASYDDSPVLKNKKQESRPGKNKTRTAQLDIQAPYGLTFNRRATKNTLGRSPPSSPHQAGGSSSPQGIVKERIETFERLIGQTRSFGPLYAPSPSYKYQVSSFEKPSSPHVSCGLNIVTSPQQLEHEHEVATPDQILATTFYLHNVELKVTSKVQDRHIDAPEELLHDALSHLRHVETTNKDGQDRPLTTEPEDSSSQRISKVPLLVKEAAEHCLSPVPPLTKAY